tara:strand:+ start:1401 stop:1763 length:363 start_codon:yes stop_codon:yes gene_type:complete
MAKKNTPPDKTHYPTEAQRQTVQLHTTIGTDQETIARVIGIDPKTLRKHYRDELDISKAKANATVGGALFNKAKGGDTSAMIFWMKTQAGWRETDRMEHTGPDGGAIPVEIKRTIVDPKV